MNIDNEKVRALKSVLYDFSRSDYVSIKSGETFSEVLTRYIDEVQAKSDIKQHNIADESNMKSSLISQYKAGTRQPGRAEWLNSWRLAEAWKASALR